MPKTMPAPSAIARYLAGQLWPQVQFQKKVAKGIYGFTCAGHGGIVAVIGATNLGDHFIEAARTCKLTELVVVTPAGKYSTHKYTPESLREYAETHGYPIFECWVGEEDCDWATIIHALSDDDFARAQTSGYFSTIDRDSVYESLRGWNERYLKALDPGYEFDPQGRVMAERLEQSILNTGGHVRCSALGVADDGVMHLKQETTKVHVLFRGKGGETIGKFMSKDTYGAIPLGTIATVEDYERFGPVEDAPDKFAPYA